MELTLVYTVIGFGLAGYSVIANDSIQTLGTFIASKQKWFKWYTLASAASLVMIFAITLANKIMSPPPKSLYENAMENQFFGLFYMDQNATIFFLQL